MKNLLIIIIVSAQISFSQNNDTLNAFPLIGVHFGGDIPMADLAQSFGPSLNMGMNFMYKTKKNYIFGIEGNYMFGRNIKEDVLKQLKTAEGYVVDNSGYPADIRLSERLLTVNLHFGKIFNVLSANPNSGLMLDGGVGYMQHRIHYLDAQAQIAAINGDIRNGLDHLTNGISTYQFIGYLFISNNRFLNFYTGIECYQGFTKSVRGWDYDTGERDTKRRFDMLLGFRFGWILPLYSRAPKQYFYN